MRILLFAQLKDVAGRSEISWPNAGPLTLEQLWQRLLSEAPGLAPHRATVRLARNWEYANAKDVFTDRDELALIPPVSGG